MFRENAMVLQIICFCCTWGFILFCIWSASQITMKGTNYLKTLHQIPCSRCRFATNDHRLKCTVNPYDAETEAAIYCRDFEPKSDKDASGYGCASKTFHKANI